MQKEINTAVVDFSIRENLAYLSHRETLKMFERAFVRASVPLVYSCGFNPHPYLSIPFPRSVGTCSEGDRLCTTVYSTESPMFEDITGVLQKQLPSGCCIRQTHCLSGKHLFSPVSVQYLFKLKRGLNQTLSAHFAQCREQIQNGGSIKVKRFSVKHTSYKVFDISGYLKTLDFQDNRIEVTCHVSQSGTVRIDELMQWLNINISCLQEPVYRNNIHWLHN